MRTLANVGLFQLGWFASVLSAAHGRPWLGVAVVAAVVAVHLAWLGTPGEWRVLVASAALGAVFDTILAGAGLVDYASPMLTVWLAPLWIVAMWTNFATTLRHALRWLSERWLVAAILGAVGGPAAYWGAERLGAVDMPVPFAATAALAVVWAVSVPALSWVSVRLR